ncbi:MAG TPA: diacylglycerol kinase family protein [Anaerolineae bacterium]|nr:diacylglycerol kinase family protein [Anaerolineae bacterium]HOQ97548.1 diacylglycerol kinase family protein [Anaerolineae bacterium]HPL28368.1 diacylglycerol kinase family protein [Anaerolineae bacterium]
MAHELHDIRCAKGWPRLVASFRCAFHGLAEAWRCQQNLRIHVLIALAVSGLAAFLRLGAVQWAILVLTYTMVIAAELFNSALEALTDLVSPGYHPLARQTKDVAAGAVLVAALGAVAVGLLLFGPPLWQRLLGMLSKKNWG